MAQHNLWRLLNQLLHVGSFCFQISSLALLVSAQFMPSQPNPVVFKVDMITLSSVLKSLLQICKIQDMLELYFYSVKRYFDKPNRSSLRVCTFEQLKSM